MSQPSDDNTQAPDSSTPMELLMRHSSPLITRTSDTGDGLVIVNASPLAERHSTPSPLRMTRPRSNPRNRTPMRYESPLGGDAYRIPEARRADEETDTAGSEQQDSRRITIRAGAGRAVGTNVATGRIRAACRDQQERPVRVATKSRKQGPSHRKLRRWTNDNFVDLASELHNYRGAKAAAEALLLGSANASAYRSLLDPEQHESKAMKELLENEALADVKEKFFEGGLSVNPKLSQSHKPEPRPRGADGSYTPEQMLHRIDARLRRVVVKACENSDPASQVVNVLEEFLIQAYQTGKKSERGTSEFNWTNILLEPPTATHRKRDDTYLTRFLFHAEIPNAGFHRLLLHGLCQFHGLQASSSTVQVHIHGTPTAARLLTASGTFSGANVKLVEHIMKRNQESALSTGGQSTPLDMTTKLEALKV